MRFSLLDKIVIKQSVDDYYTSYNIPFRLYIRQYISSTSGRI